MPADVAGRVGLDHEVEVARVDVGGDRGVGADDLFPLDGAGFGVLDVEGGGEGDVLADGEAEDVGWGGQREAVDGGVVGGDGFGLDGEFAEGGRVERFSRF